MGLFDKLFKVDKTRVKELKLTKEEAFLGIALSSVAADEVISQEELNLVAYTISRIKAFRRYHPNQIIGMLDKFLQIIRREGVGTIINSAKNSLDSKLKETAFAVAVDIILADGIVEPKEKEFLENLKKATGLSDELATKIVEVIIIKNRGVGEEFEPGKSRLFYG